MPADRSPRDDEARRARHMAGFVGELPFAPPPPTVPAFGDVIPEPRRYERGEVTRVERPGVAVQGPAVFAGLVRDGLFRAGVPLAPGGFPVTGEIKPSTGAHPEAYSLHASGDGVHVTAATVVGLNHGAASARQLVRRDRDGLLVATGTIADEPVVPLRMLAGWGLYRDHQLEWALDIAAEGKFNRVLYNWWAATAEERLTARDAALVAGARERGVELVLELRRQALGPGFSLQDPAAVATLLRHYDDAVDHGFTSFGFLFDDTDHDPFADEFALLAAALDRITARLGHEPEFWFCPRFYWFPAQMDYSWMTAALASANEAEGPSMAQMIGGGEQGPRSFQEAEARQQDYQDQLAAAIAPRTQVYLANWWSGTPEDWEEQLDAGWIARVGRPPVFWDNQQQNDFRAAVVLPMPLHQRPAAFARALAGYTLNSGVPMSAYAPASVTAGAWAWNPDGYDPAAAMGRAVARFFGAATDATVEALGVWGALLGELLAPRTGMENHYRALRRAADDGTAWLIDGRLDRVADALDRATRALDAAAHPLARAALAELRREVDRVALDLRLATATSVEDAEALHGAVADILRRRLPPVPELLDALTAGFGDRAVPGVSWYHHFVAGPLRAGPDRLLASVRKRLGAAPP